MPEVAAAEQRFLSTPVSNIFGNAAGYDRFMGRWSQLAAHLFIDFVRPPDHGAILDLGCGTGSLSLAMTAVRPNCRIMGLIDRPNLSPLLGTECRRAAFSFKQLMHRACRSLRGSVPLG
jgi:hypothetical protein